ncbi:MAG: hypothetical protein EOO71_11325 [Myxococcaceae bacterium]|nr:MAG: hypothetical protein EOO71_11325 [Myxococcaceae bacterium]
MSRISRPASPPARAPVSMEGTPARPANAVRAPTARRVTDGLDAPKAAGTRPALSLDVPVPAQAVTTKQASAAGDRQIIRVETKAVELPLGFTMRDHIAISVKPLDLGIAPGQLQAELDRATAEKLADDTKAYGADMKAAGFDSLQEWSQAQGYYGSPSHVAWAEAASARTGGQIPAEFWMRFDPFGGTAGNGPHIIPTGLYPGASSRIAMAHDTDWDLGRYFGAGPLSQLQGAPNADELGMLGLPPLLGGDCDYVSPFGHPDWEVAYTTSIEPPGK